MGRRGRPPGRLERRPAKVERLEGVVWTRERLLEAAGFKFVADTAAAVKRVRKAVQSKRDDSALRACELTFDLADVKPRTTALGDGTAPVAVEIILSHRPVATPELAIVGVTTAGLAAMPIEGALPGLANPAPVEAQEIPPP